MVKHIILKVRFNQFDKLTNNKWILVKIKHLVFNMEREIKIIKY